ncbi:MAG: spore coat associated protein CotJA [Bacillota bacterium]
MKKEEKKAPAEGAVQLELAQAYVPFQKYQKLYSPEEALRHGTLFKELYRPYPR